MDTKYEIQPIATGGHVLSCYECPLELLAFATRQMSGTVTMENIRPHLNTEWFRAQVLTEDGASFDRLRNLHFDAALTASEFAQLLPLWHRSGVYAVSADRPLQFRSSDLDPKKRYRALSNFRWQIELSIPGPSAHWGSIAVASDALVPQLLAAAEAAYARTDA